MLTVKQNLAEVMKKDGHPDRFVKGWEFLNVLFPAGYYMGDRPHTPGKKGYDMYGVFWDYPEGQMGAFPVHDNEHLVVKDICSWRETVKRPVLPEDPGYWKMLTDLAAGTDRENQYICVIHPQGVFERLHDLLGMEEAMVSFYEEPEEMHALIDFIVDVEMEFAKAMVEKEVERACLRGGKHYFIPSLSAGAPGSYYPGVMEAVDAQIEKMSARMFQ